MRINSPRFIATTLFLLVVPLSAWRADPGDPAGLLLQDPAEPPEGRPNPQSAPAVPGMITAADVDQATLRAIIEELVACGTRNSLSSWTDPKREIGCARNRILARFQEISRASGGQLLVRVDRFEPSSPRTGNKPVQLENVLAILPGTRSEEHTSEL